MAFTPTLTKDKGNIKRKSGGIWKIAASTDSGPATSLVAGDWGYVKKTVVNNKVDRVRDFDESGALVVDEKGNVDRNLQLTLMQTDKALLEFIRNTADVAGTYYALYHYDGVANGYYREDVFPICKIDSNFSIDSDAQEIMINVSIVDNAAAISFGGSGQAALPTGAHATTGTVAANAGWVRLETAVS